MNILYFLEYYMGNFLLNFLLILVAIWIVLTQILKIWKSSTSVKNEIKYINLTFLVLTSWYVIRFIFSLFIYHN
ncbi:hypothetical protein X560_1765 [Listeria fleischmannii 1991]|uniref:Uncharacterized protein n=2 Tax=Listeria fleischmannii TaxID=1069827 RepID=A0A2X3IZV9_9LIST|nr:hypothetical protein LFLEISCH_10554 [Listeria fleischmannii subsp. fleischmannii LU2006-1]KMT59224.1 hypothetical protein X560_1765 [Listeria fleischmannii 1991]SQC67230.1 Uncharacterised protein [Listeria fleischmannii subsp. fleischmannii]